MIISKIFRRTTETVVMFFIAMVAAAVPAKSAEIPHTGNLEAARGEIPHSP